MKHCLSCSTSYESSNNDCPECGYSPVLVDGFKCYAPELAHGGGGFKASYFSGLASFEESNFWFRSRNKLILWILKRYCPNFNSFLEIGCGTGYVLTGISGQYPQAALYGSEIFIEGLGFAATRLPAADLMQMDARDIPFYEEFDVIGAFDVLEHIEEDGRVLQQIHDALRPSGFLLLTVPQHRWLWSSIDEYACHVRRYTATELHEKIEQAGFKVIRSTSFVTLLLPLMLISRLTQKKVSHEKFDAASEMKISTFLNFLLLKILDIETFIIKRGINFPVGGSRLVLAMKV